MRSFLSAFLILVSVAGVALATTLAADPFVITDPSGAIIPNTGLQFQDGVDKGLVKKILIRPSAIPLVDMFVTFALDNENFEILNECTLIFTSGQMSTKILLIRAIPAFVSDEADHRRTGNLKFTIHTRSETPTCTAVTQILSLNYKILPKATCEVRGDPHVMPFSGVIDDDGLLPESYELWSSDKPAYLVDSPDLSIIMTAYDCDSAPHPNCIDSVAIRHFDEFLSVNLIKSADETGKALPDVSTSGSFKVTPSGPNTIIIDLPDWSKITVTASFWSAKSKWYLNISVQLPGSYMNAVTGGACGLFDGVAVSALALADASSKHVIKNAKDDFRSCMANPTTQACQSVATKRLDAIICSAVPEGLKEFCEPVLKSSSVYAATSSAVASISSDVNVPSSSTFAPSFSSSDALPASTSIDTSHSSSVSGPNSSSIDGPASSTTAGSPPSSTTAGSPPSSTTAESPPSSTTAGGPNSSNAALSSSVSAPVASSISADSTTAAATPSASTTGVPASSAELPNSATGTPVSTVLTVSTPSTTTVTPSGTASPTSTPVSPPPCVMVVEPRYMAIPNRENNESVGQYCSRVLSNMANCGTGIGAKLAECADAGETHVQAMLTEIVTASRLQCARKAQRLLTSEFPEDRKAGREFVKCHNLKFKKCPGDRFKCARNKRTAY